MSPELQPLIASWAHLVQQAPDAIALYDCSLSRGYTRGELQFQAEAEGRQLPPVSRLKQRVVFRAANGILWMARFLALLKHGWIAVPIDPATSNEQAEQLARSIRAAYLWLDHSLQAVNPRQGTTDQSTSLIKLTSGSTGLPKTYPFSEVALAADGMNIIKTMGLCATDRHYALIPFGHSYGLGNLVAPLLLQGCTLICGSVPLPNVIASEIGAGGATVFPAVPALLSALLRADISRDKLSSIRLVISAGAPLEQTLASAFSERFGLRIHNFYGSSETGGIAYDRTGDASIQGSGIGTPLTGVEVQISSRGKVSVGSNAVTSKGKPGLVSSVRIWPLADRARWNEHDEIVLLGRSDRTVKLSGRRVDPSEIEHAIKQTRGVFDAYCTLVLQPREHLVAAYSGAVVASAVWEKMREKLAPWKLPKRLLHLDSFPTTARGKLDRLSLDKRLRG